MAAEMARRPMTLPVKAGYGTQSRLF